MKRIPVNTPNIDRLAENGVVFRNAYSIDPYSALSASVGSRRAARMAG